MPVINIKSLFIEKFGLPDDEIALDNYLKQCLELKYNGTDTYSEVHHILPRSQFPQYRNNALNLVRLKYTDHIKVHCSLAQAYKIRAFSRTLNFMITAPFLSATEMYDILSESARKGWEKFRNGKNYSRAVELWKNRMLNGQSIMMNNALKEKLKTDSDFRNQVSMTKSKQFRDHWKDSEARGKHIQSFIDSWTDERKKDLSKNLHERYENMDDEKWNAFCDKMKKVNQSIEKREATSKTIKENWKKEEFIEKMKKRKPRGSDGSKMKEKWADPIWRAWILEKRRKSREAKQNNV